MCIALICLPLFNWSASDKPRPSIVFSCPIDAKLPLARVINDIYRQAFDALGYDFKLLHLPSLRSLSQLQEGKLDGECGRIKELKDDEKLLNIVRVDVKLMTLRLILLTYNPALIGTVKADLFESTLRIGIQLGAISIERELARADTSLNVHFTNLPQGFNMLKAGRIDLLASTDLVAQATIKKLQLHPAPMVAGELGDFDIYPYLSENRAALAAPLAQELDRILKTPNHPLQPYIR